MAILARLVVWLIDVTSAHTMIPVRARLVATVAAAMAKVVSLIRVLASRMVIPVRFRPAVVAGIALVWCWLVEFSQLTGVPARWAAHSTPSRLVLGTHFQPPDLFWSLIGVVLAVCMHATWRRRRYIR